MLSVSPPLKKLFQQTGSHKKILNGRANFLSVLSKLNLCCKLSTRCAILPPKIKFLHIQITVRQITLLEADWNFQEQWRMELSRSSMADSFHQRSLKFKLAGTPVKAKHLLVKL